MTYMEEMDVFCFNVAMNAFSAPRIHKSEILAPQGMCPLIRGVIKRGGIVRAVRERRNADRRKQREESEQERVVRNQGRRYMGAQERTDNLG